MKEPLWYRDQNRKSILIIAAKSVFRKLATMLVSSPVVSPSVRSGILFDSEVLALS